MVPFGTSPGSFKNARKVKKAKKAKKALFSKTPKAFKKKRAAHPLRKEVHILICTNHPRYKSLRGQVRKHGGFTQTALVSNIASGIAVSLGYTAAAVVPFVAISPRDRVHAAMVALRAAAPYTGAYVNECDFFQLGWQKAFWGGNYQRLADIKRRYDPEGLFVVHHGVGSEAWSDDGFTRTL